MKKIQSLKNPMFSKFQNSKVEFYSKILGGTGPKVGDKTIWKGGEADIITQDGGDEVRVPSH